MADELRNSPLSPSQHPISNSNTRNGSFIPPPVPPRNDDRNNFPLANNYAPPVYGGMGMGGGGGYGSGYGVGGYGLGGGYGYGSYAGGYNRLGGYGGSYGYQDNDLTRIAEERSRNAFESVESVVQTVSSVSMMLESTLNAVYSSFRAVLGVADQFSRLRVQFANIFASVALFRLLHWLWRRFLVLLRLKPANYANSAEFAWNTAKQLSAHEMLSGHGGTKGGSTNWPSLIFFALALGGPWLMYKLTAKIAESVQESRQWIQGQGEHYEAKVLYDFHSVDRNELSVRSDEIIRIAPRDAQPRMKGWLMGCTMDGKTVGLVPMNYIKILQKRTTPSEDQKVNLEDEYTAIKEFY